MQFKYTTSLLLHILLFEEHISRCFPSSRLHCSSLSRKVLTVSLTLFGVAIISSFIAF